MHTIKRAAELTGISESTLRAWERRYGVVSPERSEGRYRLYSEADLRALAIMSSLVNDGWTASEAAAETARRVSDAPDLRAAGAAPAALDELVAAARDLDAARVAALLDAGLGQGEFEQALDQFLMPLLGGVGAAWADGRLTVAAEHLVSYAVQRRLAGAYEAAARRAAGPTVVLGLPPGARHELGVLAFAVAARRAGLTTVYVGADLPADDWAAAVAARAASGVVIAVPRTADVVAARDVVRRLSTGRQPRPVIAVGGGAQAEVVGPEVLHLGHDIRAGVSLLGARLARRRPTGSEGSGSRQHQG